MIKPSYKINYLNEIYDFLKNKLEDRIDTTLLVLDINGFITKEPVKFQNIGNYEMKKYKYQESLGELFDCGWFKLTGKLDKPHLNTFLKVDFNCEACLYSNSGEPLIGFTNKSSTFARELGVPVKRYYEIKNIKEKSNLEYIIEVGINDLFGTLTNNAKIEFAEIVERNLDLEKLCYDIEVLIFLLKSLNQADPKYDFFFDKLVVVYSMCLYESDSYIKRSLEITKELLSIGSDNELVIDAIGHAHLDLAWLWPIRETKRKAIRTITNQLKNIEKYPNYIFGISQPQILEWLKEENLSLFNKVKEKVLEKRIELQGGMWVESDTNLTSGESLIRQMLYGINFYKDEFGIRVNNLWLPDVFGYSGALPQIIKKSGLDYFMTIKISWCLVHDFPYHTFNWIGIDGSSVICHMPPEGTYNSAGLPTSIRQVERDYKEKEIFPRALLVYGIGDGGGGPGEEHIERIKRENNLYSLPKVYFDTARHYFDKLSVEANNIPSYEGELYLENHQGTYTSQADNKYNNRKIEERLRTLEIYTTLKGIDIDKNELNKIWKEVLLYQFHDILPGSSIKRVYDETKVAYKILNEKIEKLFGGSGKYLFNPNKYDVNFYRWENDSLFNYQIDKYSSYNKKDKVNVKKSKSLLLTTRNLEIKFSPKFGYIDSIKYNNKEILSLGYFNRLEVYKDFGDAWNIKDNYLLQEPSIVILEEQTIQESENEYIIINSYKFKNSTISEKVVVNKKTDRIIVWHKVNWNDLGFMLRTNFPTLIKSKTADFNIQFGELERSREDFDYSEKGNFEMPGQYYVKINDDTLGLGIINDSKYGFYIKDNTISMNLIRSTNGPCINGDIGEHNHSYSILIADNVEFENIYQEALIFNSHYEGVDKEFSLKPIVEIGDNRINISAIKKSYYGDNIVVRLYNPTNKEIKTNVVFDNNYEVSETNLIEEINNKFDQFQVFNRFEIKTFILKGNK